MNNQLLKFLTQSEAFTVSLQPLIGLKLRTYSAADIPSTPKKVKNTLKTVLNNLISNRSKCQSVFIKLLQSVAGMQRSSLAPHQIRFCLCSRWHDIHP